MASLSNPSRRRWILGVAVLVTALFATAHAWATVMKYADLARLVEISDIIVQGRIVDQVTYLDEDYGHVVTDTTIRVERPLYGSDEETLTFQQWGGPSEDRVAFVPGDARFEPYEEVVLFLSKGQGRHRGQLFLSALGQSKYTIVRHGGTDHVLRDLSDLAFLLERPDGEDHIAPKQNESYEYGSFIAELQALIAGIKGGER